MPNCRHATVHIHHIVPWKEVQQHDYSNLIALCPNCHSLADDGLISKQALLSLKAQIATSQLHTVSTIVIDLQNPFDEKWGPLNRADEQKEQIIIALEKRGMLAGFLDKDNWPLIRCDFCEHLVSVDRGTSPQDDCMCDDDERIRVYCYYGCAQKYQRMMREIMAKSKKPDWFYTGDYYLQNTIQILGGFTP
jgi:hypothetical protein